MRCISAAYAVVRCPSVCLSRSCIVSKRIKISSKFFSPPHHSSFSIPWYQTGWRYSDGNPLTGTSNSGGIGRNRDSEPICLLLTPQQARCRQHGRRWNTVTISQVVTIISLVVYCGYSTTKCHAAWRRRPGRPRHTWLRTVEEDLRQFNIGLVSGLRRAQNRTAWRTLTGTATSPTSSDWWWWVARTDRLIDTAAVQFFDAVDTCNEDWSCCSLVM